MWRMPTLAELFRIARYDLANGSTDVSEGHGQRGVGAEYLTASRRWNSPSPARTLARIPPESSLPGYVDVALVLASVALLGFLAWWVVRLQRSRIATLSASIVAVTSCFERLGARRGLSLVHPLPHSHPVIGPIPMYPSLRGDLDGHAASIAIEANPRDDGELRTVVRVEPRRAPVSRFAAEAGDGRAFEALRRASADVRVTPREFVATPSTPVQLDAFGDARRIETDPERLDAWLALVMAAVGSLDSLESPESLGSTDRDLRVSEHDTRRPPSGRAR